MFEIIFEEPTLTRILTTKRKTPKSREMLEWLGRWGDLVVNSSEQVYNAMSLHLKFPNFST